MRKKVFWFVFFIAILLRFYGLGKVPPSLDWDEASNAYNAYSILKTGKDEHGRFLPLYNQSFGDYKPPLYMYLEIPVVAVFGLTAFSARLPSAVFGSLTVLFIYLLVNRLHKRESISNVSMFLAAITPWLLHFSRVGFEANIGLFFTVSSFTILLYSLAVNKEKLTKLKITLFLLSSVFFGLSFYSYHAQRVFVPILLIITTIIYRHEILKFPKIFLLAFITVIFLVIAPFFIQSPKEAILQRFQVTGSASKLQNTETSIRYIQEDNISQVSKIIHNRRITIAVGYLQNYFANLDPNYIFMKGDDNLRHHIEGAGMIYAILLPFFLYGTFLYIKQHTKDALFIFAWLLISPIPAAVTNVAPHAIRSYLLVIPILTIASAAIVDIYRTIKWKRAYLFTLALGILISFFSYIHNYFVHYPYGSGSWWQWGYVQAAQETGHYKGLYKKIIIDPSIEQAYIFWLFGTKYDPDMYQKTGNSNQFDNFYFSSQKPVDSNELLVTAAGSLPQGYEIVNTIAYPNGNPGILIGYPK